MAYRRVVTLGEEDHHALLSATADPREARRSWTRLMEMMAFDEVNDNTQRAMPAIFANLRHEKGIPERDRMRGAFKYAWSKNTRMLYDVRPVLQALDARGVSYRVIKGAAVQARCDRVGARVMGDIDLLIGANDIDAVEAAFVGNGYRRNGYAACSGHSDASHFDALNFNKGASHVDLHVAEVKAPTRLLRAIMDEPAVRVEAAGGTIAVPSAELLVLHAAVHGALSSGQTDLMQAALDLATLRPQVDPRRLRALGLRTGTLQALLDLDARLGSIGISGSGVSATRVDVGRARLTGMGQQVAALATESSSLARRLRDRQRGDDALHEVATNFNGHLASYRAWLRSGQFAIVERQAVGRWGGFLPEPQGVWTGDVVQPFLQQVSGVVGSTVAAQALDWRFRFQIEGKRPLVWLDLASASLDRLDAFVFCNGVPLTRLVAGDLSSRRVGLRDVGPSAEISVRPLWTTCRRCYSGLDDLAVSIVPHVVPG